jgi:hypothetical protein
MTALAVAPGRDQALYVIAGVSGGVFVSKDGGETWTPTAIATPAPFITVLAVSPDFARDGIAFAASMEDGVFRSDDFGTSWRAWSFGLFDIHVHNSPRMPPPSHAPHRDTRTNVPSGSSLE